MVNGGHSWLAEISHSDSYSWLVMVSGGHSWLAEISHGWLWLVEVSCG